MRRRLFYVLFFASPAIAIAIYAIRLRSFANVYFLSVALGLAAYTYLCNQFILAARPRFLAEGVGAKRLQILHVSMPSLVLVLAALHRVLKLGLGLQLSPDGQPMPSGFLASLVDALKHGLGFKDGTAMADFGSAAWWLLLAFSVLAAILFSKTFFLRFAAVRKIRELAVSRGLGEEKLRRGHATISLAAMASLVHVLLSSSSALSSNVVGAVWLLAYLVGCIAFYAVTTLRHLLKAGRIGAANSRQPGAAGSHRDRPRP
jgi:hypothetical protein